MFKYIYPLRLKQNNMEFQQIRISKLIYDVIFVVERPMHESRVRTSYLISRFYYITTIVTYIKYSRLIAVPFLNLLATICQAFSLDWAYL